MKKLLLFLFFCSNIQPFATAQTTVFEQDFQSSNTVSSYVGSATNQFNGITTSSGTTVSISSGRLFYNRAATGGSGYFVKTTSFAGPPSTLYIQFDLEIPTSTGPQSSVIQLRVGSNYANDGGQPLNTDTYAKLYVNFIGASGGFQLRDVDGGQNSASSYTGSQRITWVLNNSGASLPYIGPDGNTYNLANDKHQYWVGNTKAFASDLSVTTASQSISNFKMIFNGGTDLGTVAFDNFLMRSVEGTLPVSLVSFKAQTNELNQVELRWATASERDARYFSIGRSTDAQNYTEIAQIDAAGYSNTLREYAFTDLNPPVGTNYYRLSQIDTDGQRHEYRPLAIKTITSESVYPNPSDGQVFFLTNTDAQQISLQTLWGQDVPISIEKTLDHTKIMPSERLKTGLYLLKTQAGATFRTFKVSVW